MATRRRDRFHRWTACALAMSSAAVLALLPTSAAVAAPPAGRPAPVRVDVVLTGAASVAVLLLLAGVLLVAAPRLFRLIRSR
jgi:hypothetical protein